MMANNSGMTKNVAEIREFIEKMLDVGYRKFIIFPYGDIGISVKHFLNSAYGIQETYILDNHLCKYNENIKSLAYMADIENRSEFAVLLSSTNPYIYSDLKVSLLTYFSSEQIAELTSMKNHTVKNYRAKGPTTIGKHSYGPICYNHPFVESIGAFCSFAEGVDVVVNHEKRYITTSPIIYAGADGAGGSYDDSKYEPWYVSGVCPKEEKVKNVKRIHIGNDVWLGRNVIITNYVNIGNGVIAGAGAVITKDVPDYAIVGGVPAKIIKYRYSPEQIQALNEIKWWNWTDDEIRERYDDFYLPIDEFIAKYI